MEKLEQLFIKGFNTGYVLARYDATLIKDLMSHLNQVSPYIQGLFLGQKEFELERINTRLADLDRTDERDINKLERD